MAARGFIRFALVLVGFKVFLGRVARTSCQGKDWVLHVPVLHLGCLRTLALAPERSKLPRR
jgi:hypothetical protein